MNTLAEYKIIEGTTSHCQKVLNQWRHQYKLKVHKMSVTKSIHPEDKNSDDEFCYVRSITWLIILVARYEKEPTEEVAK